MLRYLHREKYFSDHRYEDTLLIADVIRHAQPGVIVNTGTQAGGMAALFADLATEWGGFVVTFDTEEKFPVDLLTDYPNLLFRKENVLTDNARITKLISQPGAMLYADGAAQSEILTYAARMPPGSLLGTHDWITGVDPSVVCPYLEGLGYVPHRHAEFEALACETYPISMTRFWRRVRTAR